VQGSLTFKFDTNFTNSQYFLFKFGWLGALFGRAKPTKAPRGDGTGGVARGRARGRSYPSAESLWRPQIIAGGAEKSQQCHKYFLQYSTFASERPLVRTWGRQTCFLPVAPFNLATPLMTELGI